MSIQEAQQQITQTIEDARVVDEELLVIKDNEINKNALTSEGSGFSIFLDEVADYIDDFHPQDTSDETIKSIKIYNDYIVMYAKILEEYFISVEDVYKKMGTFNEEELDNLFNDMIIPRSQIHLSSRTSLWIAISSPLVRISGSFK